MAGAVLQAGGGQVRPSVGSSSDTSRSECIFSLILYSVSNLADVLRQAVEKEEKVLHQLSLPGPAFHIEEVQEK